MIREEMKLNLLEAAKSGKKPTCMNPEETEYYNKWTHQIEMDRSKGYHFNYSFPYDIPETGIDFYFGGFFPHGVTLQSAGFYSVIGNYVNKWFEKRGLNFEYGMCTIDARLHMKALIVDHSKTPYLIRLSTFENDSPLNKACQISYGLTNMLMWNYCPEKNNHTILLDELISRCITQEIIKSLNEDWKPNILPALKPFFKSFPPKYTKEYTLDDWKSTCLFAVWNRDLEEKELPEFVKAHTLSEMGLNEDLDAAKHRADTLETKAEELHRLYVPEDLYPLINYSNYYEQNTGKLLSDWLAQNYPKSNLLPQLCNYL